MMNDINYCEIFIIIIVVSVCLIALGAFVLEIIFQIKKQKIYKEQKNKIKK